MKICSAIRPWLCSLTAATALWACSSGGGGGDAGGGTAAPPKLGQPCGNQTCPSGTVCESEGAFKGICTAGCTPGACMGIEPSSAAQCIDVVAGYSRCGLLCATQADCVDGARCANAGKAMVCLSTTP